MRQREDFNKLNLGCGPDWRDDFWNVDIAEGMPCDETVDVFGPLPWPDGAFSEILAGDILEHTSWMHTETVLVEWKRVLEPGGSLTLRVPNLRVLCQRYLDGTFDAREASLWIYGGHEAVVGRENWRLNAHYAGFDHARLLDLMAGLGMVVESITEEDTNLALVARG
ncbi:MAG TPA: methyltransferase domain-containing protein [Gemmatimonadaceae bacterium]|nr:methyltransferase domain-containing protein [Gemmatimonadaceae bacterium]